MDTILGLIMIYTWVHTGILTFQKTTYANRTGYEKVVTIVACTGVALIIIGVMIGN